MVSRVPLFAAALALAAGVASAQPATWQIDPSHSSAQFSVRHMMVSNVRGEFAKMSGTVLWDGKTFATAQVNVTIDAASINTREPKRDDHLRSADFFDVANHPTLAFKSTKIEPAAAGALKMTGDLTTRGVTRPVVFDVAPPGDVVRDARGARAGATAVTKISRKDFGLTWNVALEAGGVLVSDKVKITLDVSAIKQA
jgi:polyisoprenoid-binding protein YceI